MYVHVYFCISKLREQSHRVRVRVRLMPTPSNLRACIVQIARFEFCCKPAAAISLMHSGVPKSHTEFWSSGSVPALCSIYCTSAVSCTKVIDIIKLPELLNPAEECISTYLMDMIGNMSGEYLQRFLRFTTGSSVLTVPALEINFNPFTDEFIFKDFSPYSYNR